jgi:hypothetical protein
MLDRHFLKTNAPSNIGEQINVNHKDCRAGEDRKKRLYIKRVVGGVLGYCHHCNEGGFAKDASPDGSTLAKWLEGKADLPEVGEAAVTKRNHWPIESIKSKSWLHIHHVTPVPRFFMEQNENMLALQLYDHTMSFIGYQYKNFSGVGPKYTTEYLPIKDRGDASWFIRNGSGTLVICEDYLSAYRVLSDTDCSSVALLKTSMSDRTLTQVLAMDFKKIIIWLDPDKAGHDGALKVAKRLGLVAPFGVDLRMLVPLKEPKEMTPRELQDYLKGI